MRIEKAIAVSLAIHLLLSGGIAISQGIKKCNRKPDPEAVFAELVPAPVAPLREPEAHSDPDLLSDGRIPAGDPGKRAEDVETPPATPEPAPASSTAMAAPESSPAPPAALPAIAAADSPAPAPDNVATADAPPAGPDPEQLRRAGLHRMAVASTRDFYRFVPGELDRIIKETLAGGALMSQGDALIHMDVTSSGQVGQAHVQANSPALRNRLERVEWASTLPPRPLAACNAIHLRISVEGNDIRVNIEML